MNRFLTKASEALREVANVLYIPGDIVMAISHGWWIAASMVGEADYPDYPVREAA